MIPGLTQWVKGSDLAVTCGIGCRCGLDPTGLWHRLAAAAPIRPLSWELPYATGTALKKKKKKKIEQDKGKEMRDAIRRRYEGGLFELVTLSRD